MSRSCIQIFPWSATAAARSPPAPVDFINESPLSARLFTGFMGSTLAVGNLVARATYRFSDEGELQPAEQRWPIFTQPLRTEVGDFPPDMTPGHTGCELVVAGALQSERRIRSCEIAVQVGSFTSRLEVLGDRLWLPRGAGLVPSEPQPFTEMPLVWARAYGGAAEHEGVAVHHPLNPLGRGFYLRSEQAAGRPLPNLERSEARIRRWDDRPLPACWAPVVDPLVWQLADLAREAAAAPDDATTAAAVAGASARMAISAAQPGMIAPCVAEGDTVTLTGVAPSRLSFRIPTLDPRLRIDTGAQKLEATLAVAGLWVLLTQATVVVTYRVELRYPYVRRKRRSAVLVLGPGRGRRSPPSAHHR